jgi:hypothetical protein
MNKGRRSSEDAMMAVPLSLRRANQVVTELHRHHQPVKFHLFSIGAVKDGKLCAAAIVMRPVNQRATASNFVAEVSRLASDGTKNACSFLLSRCATAAFAMGYFAIQTYTLPEESGASLRAAGWACDGHTKGLAWSTTGRARNDTHPLGPKLRWVRVASHVQRAIDAERAA